MYATYEFYTTEYYGEKIASDDWEKYASRASDFLDRCTRRKLETNMPTKAEDLLKVRKACCAVAEALMDIDTVSQSETSRVAQGGAIKSISSGGESVTFEASALSLAISGGSGAVNRYLYEVAKDYLTLVPDATGEYLLYWGLS